MSILYTHVEGNPDLNWYIHWDESIFGETIYLQHAALVVEHVREILSRDFGIEVFLRTERLSVVHTCDDPASFKKSSLIFIQGNPVQTRSWCMYAFQVSHELCHIVIGEEIKEKFRWFEEALCALASRYTLVKLMDLWSYGRPELGIDDKFLLEMSAYIKFHCEANALKGFDSVPAFLNTKLSELEADCYIREYNAAIAKTLLPLFLNTPDAWRAIPYLSGVNRGDSFESGLKCWADSCPPEQAKTVAQIQKLLLG